MPESQEVSELVHEGAGLLIRRAPAVTNVVHRRLAEASERDDRVVPADFPAARAIGAAAWGRRPRCGQRRHSGTPAASRSAFGGLGRSVTVPKFPALMVSKSTAWRGRAAAVTGPVHGVNATWVTWLVPEVPEWGKNVTCSLTCR